MTRLRSLTFALVALVVAALVLGACGDDASDAALTVNGQRLDDGDFRDELDLLIEHPQFAQQAYFTASPPAAGSVIDQQFVGSVLRIKIFQSLIRGELETRGLEVTDTALAEGEDTFSDDFQQLLAELPDDYAEEFRLTNARLIVLRDDLEAEALARPDTVTEEEVRTFFDEHHILFTEEEVCARHILVPTEAEADEVIASLDGGADFAELAAERSTDPSAAANGGDLGCTGPGRYVPEFEAAVWEGPIGEVQGPVQTDYGFHVIVVDSRGVPDFETLEPSIRAFLESPVSRQGQELLNLLVERLLASAEVTVNPKYGEWDSASRSVVPVSTSRTGSSGS